MLRYGSLIHINPSVLLQMQGEGLSEERWSDTPTIYETGTPPHLTLWRQKPRKTNVAFDWNLLLMHKEHKSRLDIRKFIGNYWKLFHMQTCSKWAKKNNEDLQLIEPDCLVRKYLIF